MRYGKVHKTIRISNLFHSKYKRWHDWKTPFTTPPQCMPDEYKHEIILLHTEIITKVLRDTLLSGIN